MAADEEWTSPSDLADYAYCPRSHWYRHHPPDEGPSPYASARRQRGARYHARTLGAERARDEHGWAYWTGVLAGVGLVTAGVAWLIFR